MRLPSRIFLWAFFVAALLTVNFPCESRAATGANIEDKQAQDLMTQGDLRYSVGEQTEAVEIYKSVMDRYPMSSVRFSAQLRLGRHYFKKGDFDSAIDCLHKVAEGSKVDDEVAEALYLIGTSYFDKKDYNKAFAELRKVTSRFPGTDFSNKAFNSIGEGHFQLKDYTRAIEAFRMVGTSISKNDPCVQKLAPGDRLFIRVDDEDLRVLARQKKSITVQVTATKSGDKETVELQPVGTQGTQFVGSILTRLGKAKPGNGVLEVTGRDEVNVDYIDANTASGERSVHRIHTIHMASDGRLSFVDGTFTSKVRAVAVGHRANIRVVDYDMDQTDGCNTVTVYLKVKHELPGDEKEAAAAALEGKPAPKKYELRDEMKMTLKEQPDDNGGFHTGVFVGYLDVKDTPPDKTDMALHAQTGDLIEAEYSDEISVSSDKPVLLHDTATVVKGILNPMKAFDSVIRDRDLRVRTELQVVSALTDMGKIYKELGLRKKANERQDEALMECGKVARDQGSTDHKLLEECQYFLWRIYFEKDEPQLAADVCLNLLRNYPNSRFADQALIAMGQSAQKLGQFDKAVSFYRRLLMVQNTTLQPDAQFHIAECYEEMGKKNAGYYDDALKEYKACAEKYSESRFAPEAIVKIANFYYELKDYPRAVETYEKTLRDYPDAKFVDLILLNYGKCLFKMKDYSGAAAKFDDLVVHYPESENVEKAKKFAEYARQQAAGGAGTAPAGETKEGG